LPSLARASARLIALGLAGTAAGVPGVGSWALMAVPLSLLGSMPGSTLGLGLVAGPGEADGSDN
jgi:hypothetical protein